MEAHKEPPYKPIRERLIRDLLDKPIKLSI